MQGKATKGTGKKRNYRVAIDSDCPDEIIRAEFNPEALVRGVQNALEKNEADDRNRAL